MLQSEINWRHLAAAAVLVAGLIFAGWKVLTRPSASPNAAAPAGANRRLQDAPDPAQPPVPGAPAGLAR